MYYEIKRQSFLGWWLACSLFVYPLAVAMLIALFIPLTMLTGIIPDDIFNNTPDIFGVVIGLIFIMGIGAAIGTSIGSLQRWLLRKYLFWTADNWQFYSAIGGAIGGVVTFGGMWLYQEVFAAQYIYSLPEDEVFVFMMPIFVMAVSAVQWLALRQAVKNAWFWIFANLIAGVVYTGILRTTLPDALAYDGTMVFLQALSAALAQGLVTGLIMLWLFENHSYEPEPDADMIAKIPGEKPSVWDNAI